MSQATGIEGAPASLQPLSLDSQTKHALLLHLLLSFAAVTAYVLHLGALVRVEPAKRVRWWPAFSRQLPKVSCLLGVALGSPLAHKHLALSPALDLLLLALQFVTQEVKGGAPVDDVALALPLDLCLSFVLLGVAQHCQPAVGLHFSWVVASIVMSISVSTIPLVFGHKPPISGSLSFSLSVGSNGAAIAAPHARFHAPVTASPGGATSGSHNSGQSLLPPSTVTPESSIPPSRGSSVHNLTAAHLEHWNRTHGWCADSCQSPGCGSSSSSVVEQIMQHGQAPRVTAKPLHKVDRVSLPSHGCPNDPAKELTIMRSQGMAIEMMDKHGRSLRYDSRVRRQRVYIKTGVGVAKDAQLQQLLPRVQRTLQAQPPTGPGTHSASRTPPEGAHPLNSTPTNHDRQGTHSDHSTHGSSCESGGGYSSTATNAASSTTTATTASTTNAASRLSRLTSASGPPARASCADSTSSAASRQPLHRAAGSSFAGAPARASCADSTSSSGRAPQQQQQWQPQPQPQPHGQQQQVRRQVHSTTSEGQQQHEGSVLKQRGSAPEVQQGERAHVGQSAAAGAKEQLQQLGAALQQVPVPAQQQLQQQQVNGKVQSALLHAKPQQAAMPPATPQQQQQQQPNHRPVFGGVYVRDGCVEMTLDVLSFAPDTHSPCGAPGSGSTACNSSDSSSSNSAPAPPPLALSHLGPGACLELMGLTHKLPPPRGGWEESVSEGRSAEHVDGAERQQRWQQQQQQQQQQAPYENSGTQLSQHVHATDPSVTLSNNEGKSIEADEACRASRSTSSASQHSAHSHACSHGAYVRLQLDAGEAPRTWQPVCSAANTQQQRQQQQQQQSTQPSCKHDSAQSSLHACTLDSSPQLLGVHPMVALSSADSSGSGSDGATVPGTSGTAGSPLSLCLHVLVPGSSPCSTSSCSSSGGSSCACTADALSVTARHRGRLLPARVTSCHITSSSSNSGDRVSNSLCVSKDCSGGGGLAVAELWVEVEGPLLPGLVHFEVHAPGSSVPSSPICMLVVGRAHKGMAAELQQLQHSSAAQACEAALLLAKHLQLRREQSCQGMTAHDGRLEGSSSCCCSCSRHEALPATALHPLLHNAHHSGPRALLHDIGTWIELAEAQQRPHTGAEDSDRNDSPAAHSRSCLPCAPGSVDLSTEFEAGLSASAAAAAAEARGLALHLHATALALGWPRTAAVLCPPAHSHGRGAPHLQPQTQPAIDSTAPSSSPHKRAGALWERTGLQQAHTGVLTLVATEVTRMLHRVCSPTCLLARQVLSAAACACLLLAAWQQSYTVPAASCDSWGGAAQRAGALALLLLLEREERRGSSSVTEEPAGLHGSMKGRVHPTG